MLFNLKNGPPGCLYFLKKTPVAALFLVVRSCRGFVCGHVRQVRTDQQRRILWRVICEYVATWAFFFSTKNYSMASVNGPAVCEYCGEAFANVLQLGPHKRYCWKASYGYQSSTSFSNSDSESYSDSQSCSSPSGQPSPAASENGMSDIEQQEHNSLLVLAQRQRCWGVQAPYVFTNNNKQYLPSLTQDFTPVSTVDVHNRTCFVLNRKI